MQEPLHVLSEQLSHDVWAGWFLGVCYEIPVGNDSWGCHVADALLMYVGGGEL